MELNDLRDKIDEIDAQIVRLYEERMKVVAKIADYKRKNGLPVLDAPREKQKLSGVAGLCKEENRRGVTGLFELIMRQSRQRQEYPAADEKNGK